MLTIDTNVHLIIVLTSTRYERGGKKAYRPMTGDLLPFRVFVLSHGFLAVSAEDDTAETLTLVRGLSGSQGRGTRIRKN